jgi:hypothetical protein
MDEIADRVARDRVIRDRVARVRQTSHVRECSQKRTSDCVFPKGDARSRVNECAWNFRSLRHAMVPISGDNRGVKCVKLCVNVFTSSQARSSVRTLVFGNLQSTRYGVSEQILHDAHQELTSQRRDRLRSSPLGGSHGSRARCCGGGGDGVPTLRQCSVSNRSIRDDSVL